MSSHGTNLTHDFATRAGTAFVVGGSGGIGRVICTEMARRGSNVALTYRVNEEAAADVAAAVSEAGSGAWTVALDLQDHEACGAGIDAIAEAAGGIHTLIYAAGPHIPQRHLSQIEPSEVRDHLDVDAAGFFAVASASLPHLRESKGSIVAVTTAASRRFAPRDGLSSIPKAAVEAVVRGIAAEEGRFGVRANSVGPGMLTDGMAQRLMASGDLDERALDAARANIPLRRFGRAEDIAEVVCFLASNRAGFVTGQNLDIDGGYTV